MVAVKIFRGPAQSQKETFIDKILELGSWNKFAQLFPIFSLKNRSTLMWKPFVILYISLPG